MVTLKDVAKKAGVSYNTVSLVVNKVNKVAPETKERVLKAIKELNYQPNKAAKILASGRADTIAFISSKFTSDSAVHILREIEEGIHLAGMVYNYDLITYSTNGSIETKEKILNSIIAGKKADVIIMHGIKPEQATLKKLKNNKIEIVLIDETMEGCNSINIDNEAGAYLATEYLINKGRKNIVYIGISPDKSESGLFPMNRQRGYKNALQAHKLEIKNDLIIYVNENFTSEGKLMMAELFKRQKNIDAVFCAAGDNVAFGAIEAIREFGLKIPEDIAVIGFGDFSLASIFTPKLTTVREPLEKAGNEAFGIALEIMQRKLKEKKNVMLKTELVIRESA